jgi:hypothetical protein
MTPTVWNALDILTGISSQSGAPMPVTSYHQPVGSYLDSGLIEAHTNYESSNRTCH